VVAVVVVVVMVMVVVTVVSGGGVGVGSSTVNALTQTVVVSALQPSCSFGSPLLGAVVS